MKRLLIAAAVVLLPASALADPKSESAVEAALSSPERLTGIGNHARASSDLMLAMSFYDRALRIDPNYAPALRAASEVALALDLPQALTLAQRWVAREPQNGLAHLAAAAALVQRNRPTEAQRSLALASAAGGPEGAIAVQRALALDLLGRTKEAQISFAAALQKSPNDVAIIEAMALSFAISGDDAAALQLLQPYVERYAGNSEFQRTLVMVHALAGRVDLAEQIASAKLSRAAASAARDLLARVAHLRTVQDKAAAVHLGILPDVSRGAEAEQPPEPVETAEAAPPPPVVVPGPRQGASDASPASLQNSEAKSEAPPPAPLPAALPRLSETELKASQIWVQLASTPDRGMLPAELGRLRHKARGDLNAYNAYVQQSGAANRLLVGPFKSNADASRLEDRLEDRHIDALVSRTPAGSDISPL